MRRHPSFVGAAVLLLVCGVIGLMVTTALVAHEQAETQAAYQRETERAAEAEARFVLARRAADEMIQVAEEELADNPFQEGLRKRLLESALEYYQEFIKQRGEKPEAQVELSIERDRVKTILDDLTVLQADRQTYLLREPAVLADMGASAEQRQRLTGVTEPRESNREFRDLPREEQRRHMLSIAREHETALAAILSTKQIQRLRQIALQCQGPREPDAARALKLTTEQKDRLRTIETEAHRGFWERLRKEIKEPSAEPKEPSTTESNEDRAKATMKKMLTVLTVEQLQRWHELTGKSYQGPLFFPGRQGPPGPPRF